MHSRVCARARNTLDLARFIFYFFILIIVFMMTADSLDDDAGGVGGDLSVDRHALLHPARGI